jgi:hypothetical protein
MPRKSYTKELVRGRTGQDIPDLLRTLYIHERRTQQEIADALGVSRWLVTVWLTEYGISRADRPAIAL